MKKKILISISTMIALIGVTFYLTNTEQSSAIITANTLVTGIIGFYIGKLFEFFDIGESDIRIWMQTQILHRNKRIRISFSYLYRIEIDGFYCLIRGNRIKDKFQPVGGVYKYYFEAKSFLFDDLGCVCDHSLKIGKDAEDDLRLNLPAKNVIKFYKWFKSMKQREYSVSREFREELIDTKILDENIFADLKYKKIKEHNDGITYSKYHEKNEFLYSDIFEVILNSEQKNYLRELKEQGHNDIVWVNADEIRCGKQQCKNEANIAANSAWLI